MEDLNWEVFFRQHPIFFSLPETGITQLLEDNGSEERHYSQGSVVYKEGDDSTSVYLIGAGSVSVGLKGLAPYKNSSFLKKGDFFGESILIDQRPRTIMVYANEDCTLLEIKGHKFVSFLNEYPDIQSKILLKLGERLRDINDRLLSVDVNGVDERLKNFNTKLDIEIKAIDSSLRSAQVVFDQTKLRTDEVIRSAERQWINITAVGALLAAFLGVLGFFGVSNFREEMEGIKNTMLLKAQNEIQKVAKIRDNANEELQKIKALGDHTVINGRLILRLLDKEYDTLKEDLLQGIENGYYVPGETYNEAIKRIGEMKEFDTENAHSYEDLKKGLWIDILDQIFVEVSLEHKISAHVVLLNEILDATLDKDIKIAAYYLLVASSATDEKKTMNEKGYSELLMEFKTYLQSNKNDINNDTIDNLRKVSGDNKKLQVDLKDLNELLKEF